MQIANRFTSQINHQQQQSFNAQDQANINNIEATALSVINDGLLRAKELSVQSGNPLYDTQAIQGELDQITEQINTVASDILGQDNYISGLDASDPNVTQTILQDTTSIVSESELGAQANALASQVATYEVNIVNVSASRSRIEDTDFAKASSEQAKKDILLQSILINKKHDDKNKGLLFNKLV